MLNGQSLYAIRVLRQAAVSGDAFGESDRNTSLAARYASKTRFFFSKKHVQAASLLKCKRLHQAQEICLSLILKSTSCLFLKIT